jgi:hypothetical protein
MSQIFFPASSSILIVKVCLKKMGGFEKELGISQK